MFYNIATALCFCARGGVDPNPREGWEEVVHSDLKPHNSKYETHLHEIAFADCKLVLMDAPDPAVNPFYPNMRLADFGTHSHP